MANTDIFRAYNFVLDIQGMRAGYFTEISGLRMDIEVISYREGGAGPAERKLPGRVSYGPICLKWGLTQSKDLWNWLETTIRGEVERKEVSIILLKPDGMQEDTRWNLHNTWISCWRGAKLNAICHDAAIESVTFVYEGLERA
jgi:phage tail-like protein